MEMAASVGMKVAINSRSPNPLVNSIADWLR
jgi:hypothetical protein